MVGRLRFRPSSTISFSVLVSGPSGRGRDDGLDEVVTLAGDRLHGLDRVGRWNLARRLRRAQRAARRVEPRGIAAAAAAARSRRPRQRDDRGHQQPRPLQRARLDALPRLDALDRADRAQHGGEAGVEELLELRGCPGLEPLRAVALDDVAVGVDEARASASVPGRRSAARRRRPPHAPAATETILPSRTTTEPRSITPPLPSTIRALVTTRFCASDARGTATASRQRTAATSFIMSPQEPASSRFGRCCARAASAGRA